LLARKLLNSYHDPDENVEKVVMGKIVFEVILQTFYELIIISNLHTYTKYTSLKY
jgi:hypothetical protein